jgi:amidase
MFLTGGSVMESVSPAAAPRGRWRKGQSGNPAGRRKGSRNRATLWAEAMVEGDLETVMRGVLDSAKDGDGVAQRFCASRLMPAARERRIALPELPEPTGRPAHDARVAFRLVRGALAAGELAPGEALALLGFFTRGRLIEDAALAEDRQIEEETARQRRREEWRAEAPPADPSADAGAAPEPPAVPEPPTAPAPAAVSEPPPKAPAGVVSRAPQPCATTPMIQDPYDAFCRHTHVAIEPTGAGPLSGLRCGIKDLYDVQGFTAGCGHPLWLRTHEPATATAPAVLRLLEAGARVVGKTHTDELAYSLNGENLHYGTPTNPAAPERVPGGSSSGSAAAVAGGLVEFALGSDTGGSVRLPASYCGIYGIRPSHGRVPLEGAMPLAPSFDTGGWFARDPLILERVGSVLLDGADGVAGPLKRLLIATDAFELAGPAVRDALAASVRDLGIGFDAVAEAVLAPEGLAAWAETFRLLQGAEVWRTHGGWIETYQPRFGPGIGERFRWAATIGPEAVAAQQPKRTAAAARLAELLGEDAVLCLPTGPGIAPRLRTPAGELEAFRGRAQGLLAPAGLAGAPQVNLPGAKLDGAPLGLSLIAPRGADKALLALVSRLRGGG